MNNLEALLKKLDEAERVAKMDPDEPQYAKTRTGIETAVKQARENLGKLRDQYSAAILDNGVAIFLTGPKDKTVEFCQLVHEIGEAVVIDASELYDRLAKPLYPMLGKSQLFSAEASASLVKGIYDITREVGVDLARPIRTDRQDTIPDYQAMVSHVREIIRSEIGDSLGAAYLKKTVGREGLKIRYMGSVSPVIIINAMQEESAGLGQVFGKGRATIHVTENDTIDKEYLSKAFHNVQKQIKSKRNQVADTE